MAIWAVSDLHLSFGVANKTMSVFGSEWENHTEKIASSWNNAISSEDLVLIPGDISWAMRLEEVIPDLEWIDALPGLKVILRGNHDYWWASQRKMEAILPPSVHFIHNNVFNWKGISIGGSRLWDTEEYHFNDQIIWKDFGNVCRFEEKEDKASSQKIFKRELERLHLSLRSLDVKSETRIALTHYPPIGSDLQDSEASSILEKYHIDICVFGHLHSVKPESLPFGKKNGIRYILTSCDYLNFHPVKILD